jgi:hypothetical protein
MKEEEVWELADIRVKPFDDLLYFPTTLGMESATDSRRSKLDPEGLCVCTFLIFYVCTRKMS